MQLMNEQFDSYQKLALVTMVIYHAVISVLAWIRSFFDKILGW